eukprot:CAMPEP_0174710164 /NCGR_PEP_ID=MMETSP1094-20130205/11879_1 /TAXON_ID=156173 /ORGANISM="Chrysochromulina brevifilum, Strain UTEX LB 985" /LENGTH=54 /DNA_ID=CAMNT_0015908929 /DNA_START=23 /DNA_END=184 /DNA_ORIENTATION=+
MASDLQPLCGGACSDALAVRALRPPLGPEGRRVSRESLATTCHHRGKELARRVG